MTEEGERYFVAKIRDLESKVSRMSSDVHLIKYLGLGLLIGWAIQSGC